MKFYTHPAISPTLIQSKDGSTYTKYWRYLRPTLVLEGDTKIWEQKQNRQSIKEKINQNINFNLKSQTIKGLSNTYWTSQIAYNKKQ